MTFPEFLRAEVLRLGEGTLSHGEGIAAVMLGVSPRKVRDWHYGKGPAPNRAEVAGARILLPQAPTVSEFGRRKKPKPAA